MEQRPYLFLRLIRIELLHCTGGVYRFLEVQKLGQLTYHLSEIGPTKACFD